MKTLKDLAELVKEKEHDLAYGSETTLLGIFVDEYDYVQKIIDEETSLDISADMTDTYKAWSNAYDRMEQFINDGSDYTVERLFGTESEKYLMNPITGSVDTKENWLSELDSWEVSQDGLTPQEQFDSLVEVVRGEDGHWIEAI